MSESVSLFFKGLAMGAANVIPGVSGGTIALVTGIYERLINALKSCDHHAIKHLLAFNWRAFWQHIDGAFLLPLLIGVLASIVSLAKLLEYLLAQHEPLTMAFFFGLILLSVYFVGRTVRHWGASSVVALVIGAGIAIGIALLTPASEDKSFFYVFLCGVVAICSMILPGLSGSFVLIVMGNYALVLRAISQADMGVLAPMALGCGVGLIAFSHVLAWVYKRYYDPTVALMTGFILGSLLIIWPWKNTLTQLIERDNKPAKEVVTGYDWFWPSLADGQTWMAVGLIVLGAFTIWFTERFAADD